MKEQPISGKVYSSSIVCLYEFHEFQQSFNFVLFYFYTGGDLHYHLTQHGVFDEKSVSNKNK